MNGSIFRHITPCNPMKHIASTFSDGEQVEQAGLTVLPNLPRYIPKDTNLHNSRCQNRKSHITVQTFYVNHNLPADHHFKKLCTISTVKIKLSLCIINQAPRHEDVTDLLKALLSN
jgi:hypothetical protein